MTPAQIADDRAPLYRRVLGEAWNSLPAPLQVMHDVTSERIADGVAVIERGSGWLARLAAFILRLPRNHRFISGPAGVRILATRFRRPLVLDGPGTKPGTL